MQKAARGASPPKTRSSSLLLVLKFNAGGVLLSHTLPGAVPSAQVGLASGFGKGPGVTPPQKPPTNTTEQHTPKHTQCVGVPCHSRHCITDANTTLMTTFTYYVCASHNQQRIVWFVTRRPISTSHLHTSQCFQIWPINPIISREPQKKPHLETGFPLRCFQRLSLPYVANQPCHGRDNWRTRGMSVPVLSY